MHQAALDYEDDDDEGDGVDDIDEAAEIVAQLGFVEEVSGPLLHQLGDWNSWDGGKVGGKPVWFRHSSSPACCHLRCMVNPLGV